ncbi:hypothetical protein [Lactococcus allomyrinae]|nr:hypothetical protein [Lactococcus allomyrinae]
MIQTKIEAIKKMRVEQLPTGTVIQIENDFYIVANACGGTYIRNYRKED